MWWEDYVVCGDDPKEASSLLGFVLEAVYPNLGNHGLETIYLEVIDLGRIPRDRLSGLRAKKIALLR
ncbi:hypothetical protein HYU96_02740 [Candidatus Daviesbacteria bacterium]|nr:hypothetical protein [Candidatus Daviesbacteria bacterium]